MRNTQSTFVLLTILFLCLTGIGPARGATGEPLDIMTMDVEELLDIHARISIKSAHRDALDHVAGGGARAVDLKISSKLLKLASTVLD